MQNSYMLENYGSISFTTPSSSNKVTVESNIVNTCLTMTNTQFNGNYCLNRCGCMYYYMNQYNFQNNNSYPLYNVKININVPCCYNIVCNSLYIEGQCVNLYNNTVYIPVVPANSCISFCFRTCGKVKLQNNETVSCANITYGQYDCLGHYSYTSSQAVIKQINCNCI